MDDYQRIKFYIIGVLVVSAIVLLIASAKAQVIQPAVHIVTTEYLEENYVEGNTVFCSASMKDKSVYQPKGGE